jgi:hypothetical protein
MTRRERTVLPWHASAHGPARISPDPSPGLDRAAVSWHVETRCSRQSIVGQVVRWEQRLREMVVAGGALATGCSASAQSPPADAGLDESAPADAAALDGGAPAEAAGFDVGPVPDARRDDLADGPSFCCNANPDPCCEQLYCGVPLSLMCAAELCQLEGGAWTDTGIADGGHCASLEEAGAKDAEGDGDRPD